ncbi:hypothetical protein C6I20_04030 [Aeromicrobium sp. A1-2]|uniref:N-acyl homoserine lactonase family protein n=1 Tax=Aeromicrobium sp. A1-2 TaxID=2107713 RepID=UPI000E53EDB9|nr:N-acyl homoserine lactonase family protein [Aeromicrobium sp. A1-2]AXT84444.1 hypothetical protein C6I20_04030 [Aeromicrobium sp. A1-2]
MTKMYAFHGGGEQLTRSVIDPFDDDCGAIIDAPYFFYMIQHPEGTILFDTGAHVSFIDDPRTRLGEGADKYAISMSTGDDVVSQIASVGVEPESIDVIVPSHLHYDHCGGMEFFPNARIYLQRAELEFANNPPIYQRDVYVPADYEQPLDWNLLDGEHDVFNDGSVVIFPTPGHTPGHQSMLVRLKDSAFILVGDAAYDPEKMQQRRLPAVIWSPDEMIASWELLEAKQREYDAELIFTHDINFREKTRVAPAEWYE